MSERLLLTALSLFGVGRSKGQMLVYSHLADLEHLSMTDGAAEREHERVKITIIRDLGKKLRCA